MSYMRKAALVLVLSVATISGGSQPSSALIEQPPTESVSRLVLKKGWCDGVCDTQCASHGGCADSRVVGCTCYWVCEDQDDGEQICTGDIGVKICAD